MKSNQLVQMLDPVEDLWGKQTVNYAIKNESVLLNRIRAMMYKRGINDDEYEIYSDLISYLLKYEDYSIEKALELKKERDVETIITVELYVYASIGYTMKRRLTAKKKHAHLSLDKCDSGYGLLDKLESKDDELEDAITAMEIEDIESSVKGLLHKRYRYGFDLIQYLYIKFMGYDVPKSLLNILGVKYDPKVITNDTDVRNFIASCVNTNRENVKDILGKYVYCKDILDEIENFQLKKCV